MATPAILRFVVEFVHPNINPIVRVVERFPAPLGGWHAIEHKLGVELEPGTEVPAAELLAEVALSRFGVRRNKHVAVVPLATWYWVAVVGDNGEMRGRPHLVRHTLSAPGYEPARYEIWGEVIEPQEFATDRSWRMKYFLRRAGKL